MVQKIGKIGPSGNIKPIQGKRLDLQVSIFGNQGPREPPFSRAQANRKRAKGKQETRNKPKKGLRKARVKRAEVEDHAKPISYIR